MEVDLKIFTGVCDCGREHRLDTKRILLESGATVKMGAALSELGLTQNGAAVCDDNTRVYAEKLGVRVLCLPAEHLHADEKGTALLAQMMPPETEWLIACGSGTIHDITRYEAHKRSIPFVSYPTAASVDGFVSTVSAMTWYGFKKTLPGVAPLAVVADTDVFSAAPHRLTASGIGDVLGKYTALADWKIANMVLGEAYCPRIADIMRQAVDRTRDGLDSDCESLMYALLLSGLAMQLWGNSRPASGAEHHLSHFWEMGVIHEPPEALHGEKVGVGTLLALRQYKKAASDGLVVVEQYAGLPENELRESFGELYPVVAEENEPDLLAEVPLTRLRTCLPNIFAVIALLPCPDALEADMRKAGCLTETAQLGLPETLIAGSLSLSPYIRRRLTFMRLLKLLR